ncbi:unnamed protein product [Durusdinium trenchii]|uniref:Equilibrative nucleoside transporter n=1 Tax=Durusdinium trenchii TaxID=1381693 RepID=A0ABP0PS57_9DINO
MTAGSTVSSASVEDGRAGFGPPMTGLVPLFTMLGFLTLAAWNFYLTAVGFFALWFPGYQWAFVASMTYQAMNVLGTSTMVKVGQKVPFRAAYLTSLTIQMVMILMMPMLAFWSPKEVHGEEVIPSTWGFAAALCCCAVLGLAESCFTSLICGLAGSMGDPKLMGAIMTGQGIVGVVCPVLMLSLKFLSGDPMQWKYQVVFGFFGFCAAMQVLGLFVVRYVPTSHQDHRLAEATMVDVVRSFTSTASARSIDSARLLRTERNLSAVLQDVWPQLVNICMIFVVTFVVFPGVAASWAPQLEFFTSKGRLGQDWYTTLVVGIFQIFDVVGRSTPKALEKIGISASRLFIPVWLRCLFIPAFMLLQRYPGSLPAPWQDYLAFATMALFAASNGWCSTLSMIYGPQQVQHPDEQHRAGVIMELGLILGIFAGSVLALLTQLGKFGAWLLKLAPQRAWWKGFHHTGALLRRLAPRPVYFLLPGAVAKAGSDDGVVCSDVVISFRMTAIFAELKPQRGPPTALNAATCAWPLYIELCSDVVLLDSERWQKSPWARPGRWSRHRTERKVPGPIPLFRPQWNGRANLRTVLRGTGKLVKR